MHLPTHCYAILRSPKITLYRLRSLILTKQKLNKPSGGRFTFSIKKAYGCFFGTRVQQEGIEEAKKHVTYRQITDATLVTGADQGCSVDKLPMIVGPGSFTDIKFHYEEGETVRLVCERGYGVERIANEAACVDGAFEPSTLKCRKGERRRYKVAKFADFQQGRGLESKYSSNCKTNFQSSIYRV